MKSHHWIHDPRLCHRLLYDLLHRPLLIHALVRPLEQVPVQLMHEDIEGEVRSLHSHGLANLSAVLGPFLRGSLLRVDDKDDGSGPGEEGARMHLHLLVVVEWHWGVQPGITREVPHFVRMQRVVIYQLGIGGSGLLQKHGLVRAQLVEHNLHDARFARPSCTQEQDRRGPFVVVFISIRSIHKAPFVHAALGT